MPAGRVLERSKRRFRSARAAWADIARRTRVRPGQVRAMHTRASWRWRVVK